MFSFQITKREPDWPESENILIPSSNSGGQVAWLKTLTGIEAKLPSEHALEGLRHVRQNFF